MRTSFHHQPEAQHPIFQLSTSWQADYPIFRGQSGHWLGDGRCPLLTQLGHRLDRNPAVQRSPANGRVVSFTLKPPQRPGVASRSVQSVRPVL